MLATVKFILISLAISIKYGHSSGDDIQLFNCSFIPLRTVKLIDECNQNHIFKMSVT